MSKISKSPERHTFQADNYVNRCEEEGKEPSDDYLNLFKTWRQQDEENMIDPKWQKDNMEYDLRSTEWILEKVRGDDVYAQNLYAAMCNSSFQKQDVWLILKDSYWSCTWRSAGGIVADLQDKGGDYMDWYCSGIGDGLGNGDTDGLRNFVSEGTVTDDIAADLALLGWRVAEEPSSE